MKKEKKIMSRLLACGLAAILPVASGMSVRAEESGESSSDAGMGGREEGAGQRRDSLDCEQEWPTAGEYHCGKPG